MRLVSQNIIHKNNPYYKDMLELCHRSKNLYNATLFEIRQYYFVSKKYLSYPSIDKKFKDTNNPDYRSIPAQAAQQTMRAVDSSFKSFFRLVSKKKSKAYDKKISIPKYLNKDGFYMIIFPGQTLSHKELWNGIIHIPKTDIRLKTIVTNIKQVRFIPKGGYVLMEIIYEKKEDELKSDNSRYAAIDLGINNLATVTSNISKSSFLDLDPIPNLKDKNIPSFSGNRIKRGLYVSGTGRIINADVNGSYNIMRKEVGDASIPTDRGFVFNPIRLDF